jgi:glutathionylspermidine synthase
MDTARAAGIETVFTPIRQVGWRVADREFVDMAGRPARRCFKLYPWEWLVADEYGRNLLDDRVRFVEPAWKMVLSNKGILPILWELFPGHPNLLPAAWEPDGLGGVDYVAKPALGREGGNVRIVSEGSVAAETVGTYGKGRMVYQQAVRLPRFDGQHVVIGSWIVGDKAAGMIVRESPSPIVTGSSRIVPHLFW